MEPSKVYFTDMRALPGTNLQQKLKRLILKAGIGQIDFQDKYAAIKIHFGEPGNLSYLRPNFAKTVADAVKELGGRPFLTDCNTLYVGRRKNALDHIEAAYENGFSPFSTGCQIIIADGLKGTDEVDVPVRGGEYIREAHIGRAVMDADIFISLSHFKGTRARASAAPSRISAWAAVRAQERWTCIARVSRTWTKAFAGAAACA